MIQTVGIKFEAQGLAQVSAEMRTLAAGVKSLVTAVSKLETLNTTAAVANLNKLATGMTSAASQLVTAASQINSATASFTAANAVMGRGRPPVTTGTGATTGHSSERGIIGDTMVTTGRLLKYSAAFGMVYGAKQAAGGLLGAGREDMAEPAFRLAGVGITDRQDKRKIEDSVTEFLKRNPYMGKISEGVAGAAELASAIPFGDPRHPGLTIDLLNKMNQMNMVYAKLSEMTPKQAADSGIMAMNAIIGRQSKEEQDSYYKDPKKLEALYDKVLGIQQKTIDVSKMTGQDIADWNKHSLPIMLSRGWSYEQSLALASLEKDRGYKVSSGSRAMKNLYSHEDKIGLMMALGDKDEGLFKKLSGMKKAAQLEEGYKYFQQVKAWAGDDPTKMLDLASDAKRKAEARGVNTQKLISSEFAQYWEELLSKEFVEAMRNRVKDIQDWRNAAQREMLTDKAQQDENPRFAALSQKLDAIMKQLGRTPGDAQNTPAGALYTGAEYVLNAANLLATALTEPSRALEMLATGAKAASDRLNGMLETKETKQANEEVAMELARKNLDKLMTPTSNAGGQWPQATFGWPFEAQARYNPMPGFSMFNVPNFANVDASPGLRAATPEERKTMHEVRGEAQIEVKIDDQGLFQQIKKLITLYPTTQSGGGMQNSTARQTPTMTQ